MQNALQGNMHSLDTQLPSQGQKLMSDKRFVILLSTIIGLLIVVYFTHTGG